MAEDPRPPPDLRIRDEAVETPPWIPLLALLLLLVGAAAVVYQATVGAPIEPDPARSPPATAPPDAGG